MCENRVLRRIFGPKRDEVTGEWGKLQNEEYKDPYSSINIIRVIKSRRRRWARHVANTGRGYVHTGVWWRNLRERDTLEDPSVNVDNIKMDLQEVRWNMGWIELAQDRDRW